MTTDLPPKTRRLISRSMCPHEMSQFARWLSTEGYTVDVIHLHLIYLRQGLARLTRTDEASALELIDVEWAFDPGAGPHARRTHFLATRRAYMRFLRARDRLIEPEAHDRFANLRREYGQYLVDVRGLSRSSRWHHTHTVADFLVRCVASRNLSALTPRDIEAFVVLRSREVSRHSMQHIVAQVRAFLRFCHDHDQLTVRLDQCIDTPRTYRDELPPRALAWQTVQSLLASIDRASKSGWRDYCILHLIAYYGLRPCEVVSLRLDSIDWERCILRVKQQKTHSALSLPLAATTI